MGILEKIQDIEKEIAKTQKNKATEYHLGLLKAKLAKYRVSDCESRGTANLRFALILVGAAGAQQEGRERRGLRCLEVGRRTSEFDWLPVRGKVDSSVNTDQDRE